MSVGDDGDWIFVKPGALDDPFQFSIFFACFSHCLKTVGTKTGNLQQQFTFKALNKVKLNSIIYRLL